LEDEREREKRDREGSEVRSRRMPVGGMNGGRSDGGKGRRRRRRRRSLIDNTPTRFGKA
jgi:hypothetical protein